MRLSKGSGEGASEERGHQQEAGRGGTEASRGEQGAANAAEHEEAGAEGHGLKVGKAVNEEGRRGSGSHAGARQAAAPGDASPKGAEDAQQNGQDRSQEDTPSWFDTRRRMPPPREIPKRISPTSHAYGVFSADDDDPNAQPPKVSVFHHRQGLRVTSVFTVTLSIVLLVVLLCALFPNQFLVATNAANAFITNTFGWYYLLLVTGIVVFCVVLGLSPSGAIRLGDPDSKPEHSRASWIAMLFSAGMGIGLVFYGAAEPLAHFAIEAPEADPGTMQALQDSMKYCLFHWGISAWAVYAVVALSLAYFKFRKKEKSLLSVTLKPLFGKKMNGPAGRVIDIVTSFATVAGVATSLGLGAMQINGGLSYLWGVPYDSTVQLIIIAITTCCFIASAVSGINKGVKLLSNLNVLIAIGLMAAALVVGPAVQIMNVFVDAVGGYLQDFLRLCLRLAPYDTAQNAWIGKWTLFFWAWWISWSPFVGVFIARISKGRTVREFLLCVILVPTVFSSLWFAVFGTLACGAQINGADLASLPTEQVLFGTFAQYPGGMVLSVIAVVLVFSFFVTSADSATFVLASLSEDGNLTPHRRTKVVWGVLLSLIAAILLLAGGLDALQNILIISALPFSVVLVLMCVSLHRELVHERLMMGLFLKPDNFPDRDKPYRSYEDEVDDRSYAQRVFEAQEEAKASVTVVAYGTDSGGGAGDAPEGEEGAEGAAGPGKEEGQGE